MKEMVEYIVKNLVVNKEDVKVTETEEENQTVISVSVHADDMGRVIGKSGNVASSIRTIIKSISSRAGKKVFVKFGE